MSVKTILYLIIFVVVFSNSNAQNLRQDSVIIFEHSSLQLNTPKNQVIYEATDIPGGFYLGNVALGKYIKQNLKYPSALKGSNLTDLILIKFVIEKDSTISNFDLLTVDSDKEFIEESMNLLRCVPKWIPARINDETVRAYFTIPFRFCPEGCAGW